MTWHPTAYKKLSTWPLGSQRVAGPLSAHLIVAAALRIVDRRGLQPLTMRGVGEALGYEAMSLYKHVPGKQALLIS